MAGDWSKIEHATPDKPEVIAIAALLGIDQDAAFGKLCRIWFWADQQTVDGNAARVTKTFLDRTARVTGFANAMEKVGWLNVNGDSLTFPNFGRHNGKTAKTRALTAKRVSAFKQKSNAEVTPAALPREEKRREEDNKGNPLTPFQGEPPKEAKPEGEPTLSTMSADPPDPPRPRTIRATDEAIREYLSKYQFPEKFSGPEFLGLLFDWMAFKRSRNQGYKLSGYGWLTATLNRFKDSSIADFAEAMQESQSNNWAGIFPPKNGGPKSNYEKNMSALFPGGGT